MTTNQEFEDVGVKEAIRKSLRAYAMEFFCRKEAERTANYGGEYALRCSLYADWWLAEARRYRRIADNLFPTLATKREGPWT